MTNTDEFIESIVAELRKSHLDEKKAGICVNEDVLRQKLTLAITEGERKERKSLAEKVKLAITNT